MSTQEPKPINDESLQYLIRRDLDAGFAGQSSDERGKTVELAMVQFAMAFTAVVGALLQSEIDPDARNDTARHFTDNHLRVNETFFAVGAKELQSPFGDLASQFLSLAETAANRGGTTLAEHISDRLAAMEDIDLSPISDPAPEDL